MDLHGGGVGHGGGGRSQKYGEHGARDAGKHQLAEIPNGKPAPGDEEPGARGGLGTMFFSTGA
jgi:hypothetical protein